MSESVKMPALGESVTEGTVSRWLKQVGEFVNVDEALLEVSTDKVDSEVPAPISGVVTEILVPEDETVSVGTVLCVISENADATTSVSAPVAPVEEVVTPAVPEPVAPTPVVEVNNEVTEPVLTEKLPADIVLENQTPVTEPLSTLQPPVIEMTVVEDEPVNTEQVAAEESSVEIPSISVKEPALNSMNSMPYVTPIVRKLAKDNGIDLSKVVGTGIGGRIRRKDTEDAVEAKRKAEEAAKQQTVRPTTQVSADTEQLRGKTVKMSRLRQVISNRMIESIQTSAQLTSVVEVDCSKIWALREEHKNDFYTQEGIKLTFLPFFVKVAAAALRNHPKLNASIVGNEIVYHDYENIGIAVDTPKGLLVPVIRDINNLSTTGIAKSIADIATRARNNGLNPDELSGSTFTITNTGSGGTIMDTPIINQPEVAILGIPKIVRRPVVVRDEFGNETIGIRPMVYLCLSYDHRLIDGADAARYLGEIKATIESGDLSL